MYTKTNFYTTILLLLTVFVNLYIGKIFHTGILLVMIFFLCTLIYIVKRNVESLLFFITCTVCQNLILIISSTSMTQTDTTMFIFFKELIIYICASIYLIKFRLTNARKQDIVFILFVLYSLANILLMSPSLSLGIVGFRQISVVPFCFYFGMSLKKCNEKSLDGVLDLIVYIAIIVSIIGLFIMLFPVDIWNSLGYGEYWKNKTGSTVRSISNFSSFFTYDLGFKMKRMVSVFADPLVNAHFVGIAFVILFTKYKKNQYIIPKILLTVTLVLSMSKSSVILIVCIILVKYYSRIKNKMNRFLFALGVCGSGVVALLYLAKYATSLTTATSMGNHMNSLIYGLQNPSMMGTGYGSVGYNSIIMGADISEEGIESLFSTLMGQAGIIGIFLFYAFIIMIIWHLIKVYLKEKNVNILLSLILSISVLLETLLSASSVSMLGTGLYFCVLGMTYKIYAIENV